MNILFDSLFETKMEQNRWEISGNLFFRINVEPKVYRFSIFKTIICWIAYIFHSTLFLAGFLLLMAWALK